MMAWVDRQHAALRRAKKTVSRIRLDEKGVVEVEPLPTIKDYAGLNECPGYDIRYSKRVVNALGYDFEPLRSVYTLNTHECADAGERDRIYAQISASQDELKKAQQSGARVRVNAEGNLESEKVQDLPSKSGH